MFKRFIASLVCLTFCFSNLQYVHAQPLSPIGGDFSINQLPLPGTMVGVSAPFVPLALKGLIVDPQKPLEFRFIVDMGSASGIIASEAKQTQEPLKQEINRLIKYFLAGLTIPEGDLWVNLSPYEKDRVVPEALGQTDLGRDLLAQDYILKQLTASLIYPEKGLGKEFWSRVYAEAQEQFGTTNIPVNTFNKVWILPDRAQVYENGNAAYVTKATLKVMLDEDYTALYKHQGQQSHSLASHIIRQIILPEIEKEVNTGKNFAQLRQIYQALILARWYKQTIQNGLLDAVYTNKKKIAGINLEDPAVREEIYQRYLQAYKKGAFNYIKEGSAFDGQSEPRKYFSGGITNMGRFFLEKVHTDISRAMYSPGILEMVKIEIASMWFGKTFKTKAWRKEQLSAVPDLLNHISFTAHIFGLYGLAFPYVFGPQFHEYLEQNTEATNFAKKFVLLMLIRNGLSKRYLGYLIRMANDNTFDIRNIARRAIAALVQERKVDLNDGNISENLRKDIARLIDQKLVDLDGLEGYVRIEMMKYAHLNNELIAKNEIFGANFELAEAWLDRMIDEYSDDPFILEYLFLFIAKDFRNLQFSARLLDKILALFTEFPREKLIEAAASLSYQDDPNVVRTLIEIFLKTLDGMDAKNMRSEIDIARACAEALVSNGRGDFNPALDQASSPQMPRDPQKAIFVAIYPHIDTDQDLTKRAKIFYDQLVRKILPRIASAPPKPEVGKVKTGSRAAHAMLTRGLTRSNSLATVDGGIDLNQIKISPEGKTIVQFDQAELSELTQDGFEGFEPVIESITIIQSPLPVFKK